MRYLWWLALVAGCLPPPRYLVADVAANRVPIAGALVAAECGQASSAALTDERGQARLALHGNVEAARCRVTVAAPALPTFEGGGASLCTAPRACPPMFVDLARTFALAEVPR